MPQVFCKNVGSIAGSGVEDAECTDGAFERRGKLGRRAVFRCRECKLYFVFKTGLLGVRVKAVTPHDSGELEFHWVNEQQRAGIAKTEAKRAAKSEHSAGVASADKGVACPACGRRFRTEKGRDQHLAAKHSP